MDSNENLLTTFSEECQEIAEDALLLAAAANKLSQSALKCLRFGMDDRNPEEKKSPDNRERLVAELNDLMGVISLMVSYEILPENWSCSSLQAQKQAKVLKYRNRSRVLGALTDNPNPEETESW